MRFRKRQTGAGADKAPAFHNRLYRRKKLACCIRLDDVAARPRGQRSLGQRPVLADEENALRGMGRENSLSHLNSAQRRKPDIQQDQVGLENRRLLNCFWAVERVVKDVPFASGLECAANVLTPWLEVVDDEHAVDHVHEIYLAAYSNNFGPRTQARSKEIFRIFV